MSNIMKKSLANTAALLWNKHGNIVGLTASLRVPLTTTASPSYSAYSRDGSCSWSSEPRRALSSSSCSSSIQGVSNRGGVIIEAFSSSSSSEAAKTIHLPPADGPVGLQLYKKALYCPTTRVLRTSTHVGSDDANQKADGIVGDTVTPEDARSHARNSGLRLLATIHDFLDGDLGRVEQILHLRGMVKAAPGFAGHASVIDGCSEVLAEALGADVGIGTRECFGVGSLGASVACTLELKIRP